MRYLFVLLTVFSLVVGVHHSAAAQQNEPVDSTLSIIDAIVGNDGMVVIIQPDVLTMRLAPNAVIRSVGNNKKDKRIDPHIRYRVQVYSDNNRQSAKANAEYRKRLVEQRMPGVPGYVSYDAPYWRVRIGNYQTEAEAVTAMKQIKSNFPAFSSDVRIVKVRVD